MSNIAKREFEILGSYGERYLEWRVDAKAHCKAIGLENTITGDGDSTPIEKAKAIVFLRHHLHEQLKSEYLHVDEPKVLWEFLKERFGHQDKIIGPKARYDWTNLRFQDYGSVGEYNSRMLTITSQLRLCGEDVTDESMIEKTLSTMHIENVILQEQYRERRFKKYSELIAVLQLAEQNNKILFANHNQRPTGSRALPEANATGNVKHWYKAGKGPSRTRGKGKRRHDRHDRHVRPDHHDSKAQSPKESIRKKFNNFKGKSGEYHNKSGECHRCGTMGHWQSECRTAKHLVDLYQADRKGKGKRVETNYVEEPSPIPNLNVADFLMDDIDDAVGTMSLN